MKNLILFLLIAFLSNVSKAQTQLGADIDGEAAGDWCGSSVSMSADGKTVAIGSPNNGGNEIKAGHVRVYKYVSGAWTQLGADIDGEAANDYSGFSVSLSADGSIVAIGAYSNDGKDIDGINGGHVRIFKYTAGVWTQLGSDIDGEAAFDQSGLSVSLSADGSIVAIGASFNNGNGQNAGHVRIYKFASGLWTQLGEDINGEELNVYSGRSVSLSADGSIVAIGTPYNNSKALNDGQVRIFKYDAGAWIQLGNDINGKAESDFLGSSVSLSADGSTVAASGIFDGISENVSIYKFISGVWTQLVTSFNVEDFGKGNTNSISLSGDGSIVAIGAPFFDVNKINYDAGRVKIFKYKSGNWDQLGIDIDGETAYDKSGFSVSLSADGKTLAIGGPGNADNGFEAGHVRVYSLENLTSIDPVPEIKILSIYPNPASKEIKITADASLLGNTYRILNRMGQEVLNGTLTEKSSRIDLSGLSAGYYLLSVGENNIQTHKLVIE